MNQCASDLKHYHLRGYWGILGTLSGYPSAYGGLNSRDFFCINRLRTI